jgi:hypothetical protein
MGVWTASRPGRAFTPGERTPSTHCTGDWVGPRAGLDTEARGKILCPRRRSNLDRPVVQPVVRHYTDWANPAHPKWSYLLQNLVCIYPLCSRYLYRSERFAICVDKTTERRGQAVNTSALCFGVPRFKSRTEDRLSWLRLFVVFLTASRQMLEYFLK